MPERHGNLREIIFGTSDKAENNRLRRMLNAKEIAELGPRVYTTAVNDDPAAVMRRNWHAVAARLYPNAVITHRTAIENGPAADGTVCLTWSGLRKTVAAYPGIVFRLFKGPGPLTGDSPFMDGLHLASRPRALLENLTLSRSRDGRLPASLGRAKVEEILDRDCRIHGRERLNQLRSAAAAIAPELGMEAEYRLLDNIVGMVVGTQPGEAVTDAVRARMAGVPLDSDAVARFQVLRDYLAGIDFPVVQDPAPSGAAWRNFAFLEAYFSNFIEGTEFEVDEAYRIVFEGVIPQGRPEDARDVIGTFRVVVDQEEMSRAIPDAGTLIDVLKARNYVVMSSRVDKMPGEFKAIRNRAGSTYFVDPDLVVGTLRKGFDLLETLRHPFSRALFIKYLIVDVHPFLDGNGRTARIMMNAELVKGNEARILVPSVFRNNYIRAVARMRSESDPTAYVRTMEFARTFSSALIYDDYDAVLKALESLDAFKKPDDARLKLPPGTDFVSAVPPASAFRV